MLRILQQHVITWWISLEVGCVPEMWPACHQSYMVAVCTCRHLSLGQAEMSVPLDMRQYAKTAWTFLNNAGYINFGVAPDIAKPALDTPQTRGTIIVVGAGLAGEYGLQSTL